MTSKINNLNFGQAIEYLKKGYALTRQIWINENIYIIKQIDSSITQNIIPKMTSLPQSCKTLLMNSETPIINYTNQCLKITQTKNGNFATNYIPDWNDIFADDWCVIDINN